MIYNNCPKIKVGRKKITLSSDIPVQGTYHLIYRYALEMCWLISKDLPAELPICHSLDA